MILKLPRSIRSLCLLQMRTVIVQSAWWQQLGLLGQSRTQGGVLDAELVDERTTLLPAAVRLIGGREGSVEELRATLE